MVLRQPGHDVWQTYWTSVYRRIERGIGWVLFSIGAILLTGYGLWQWIDTVFADRSVPDVVRVGILLTLLGTAILIISVVREKLFVNRNDSFKDVTR